MTGEGQGATECETRGKVARPEDSAKVAGTPRDEERQVPN